MIVTVLQETVISQRALSPRKIYQILWMDFPALHVTVVKWAKFLAKWEGDFLSIFSFGILGSNRLNMDILVF